MKLFNNFTKIAIKFHFHTKITISCLLILMSIANLPSCNQNHDPAQSVVNNNEQSTISDYQESEYEENETSCTKVTALIPFIEQGLIQNQTCQSCHFAHHRNWPGLTSEVHGDYYYSDPEACKTCHGEDLCTSAPQVDWVSCSSGCHHDGPAAEGHSCKPCETCHNGGGGGGDGCFGSECHGEEGSHATHYLDNNKGPSPALDCDGCHDMDNLPNFYDGVALTETQVCDNCHSPEDLDDPIVGAKTIWHDMAYNEAGDALQPGKEKWCAGCHDDVPATSQADGSGISAPNIAGDDSTYGFYVNGHGRTGANKDCIDCHDVTYNHIDGESRTYSFDSAYFGPSQSGIVYAESYRLKDIDGEVPLMIPANYNITFSYNAALMRDTAFRLCFDSGCHESSNIFDNTPGNGIDSNFKASSPNPPRNYSYAWGSGADTNEHVSHILNYVGPFWDSDWDITTTGPGGLNGNESLMACSSCHNVHGVSGINGSTNEVMIRDGSLTGRTGYGFSYVVEDTGAGGYPWVTSNGATQATSVGAIFRDNTSDMCGGSMCHGNPVPPAGDSYNATGSSWDTYLEYYRPWEIY